MNECSRPVLIGNGNRPKYIGSPRVSHDYKRKGVKPRLGTDPRVVAITGVFVTDMHTDTYTGASRGPSHLEQEEEQSKKRKDGSSRAKVLNQIELPVCGSISC